MVEEPSHVPAYPQDGAVAYNNTIPITPSGLPGCSFPPEPVMSTQV